MKVLSGASHASDHTLYFYRAFYPSFVPPRSAMTADAKLELIKNSIRGIPDFPKPGILFWDVTTLLLQPEAFQATTDLFVERYKGQQIDVVAGGPALPPGHCASRRPPCPLMFALGPTSCYAPLWGEGGGRRQRGGAAPGFHGSTPSRGVQEIACCMWVHHLLAATRVVQLECPPVRFTCQCLHMKQG